MIINFLLAFSSFVLPATFAQNVQKKVVIENEDNSKQFFSASCVDPQCEALTVTYSDSSGFETTSELKMEKLIERSQYSESTSQHSFSRKKRYSKQAQKGAQEILNLLKSDSAEITVKGREFRDFMGAFWGADLN